MTTKQTVQARINKVSRDLWTEIVLGKGNMDQKVSMYNERMTILSREIRNGKHI